ncbi:MAG TPA: hypothetical protein VEY30_08905, partial [Myxococcaceae bacterium]|nr:hypothetical protein [Myxococcaceae bacterium]
ALKSESALRADFVGRELPKFDDEMLRVAEAAGVARDALNQKISDRRKELEGQALEAHQALDDTHQLARATRKSETEEALGRIAATRAMLDQGIDDKLDKVQSEVPGKGILKQQEDMVLALQKKVAAWVVQYDDHSKMRKSQLAQAARDQIDAYKAAAQEDVDHLETAPLALSDDLRTQAKDEVFAWLEERKKFVNRELKRLGGEIDKAVKRYQDELREAGKEAVKQVREWGDRQLGRNRSWIRELIDKWLDWAQQGKLENEAWAQQRARTEVAALGKDMLFLARVRLEHGDAIKDDALKKYEHLGDEQKAILETFYKKDGGGNAVEALAAAMAIRIKRTRAAEIDKALNDLVMSTEDVDLVVKAANGRDRPNPDIEQRVLGLYKAMKGWGTVEGEVFRNLSGLTPLGGRAVERLYQKKHNVSLRSRLTGELDDWTTGSSHEADRATAMLSGDPIETAVVELDEAMKGGWTGAGTDEDKIFEILESKTPEQLEAIKRAYKARYGRDLVATMHGELDDLLSTHHDAARMHALDEGRKDDARAVEADQAMRGGWFFGLGTNRKGLENIYDKIDKEVQKEAEEGGHSSAWVRAEVKKRNAAYEQSFERNYGKAWASKKTHAGQSALQAAYHDEMSGADLDVVTGLHEQDYTKADTARVAAEHKSLWADDEVMNKAMNAQAQRDFADHSRDATRTMYAKKGRDEDLMSVGLLSVDEYRKNWNSKEIQKKKERIHEEAQKYAKGKAPENWEKFEKTYNDAHKGDLFRGDSLRTVIFVSMSGAEQDKAYKLVEQHGYLSDDQLIEYAMRGAGTDEDTIKNVLKGKSEAQIQKIALAWEKANPDPGSNLAPGERFKQRVLLEFGGREEFDVGEMLHGEPQDAKQKLEAAKRKLAFEKRSTNMFADEEIELLEKKVKELEGTVSELDQIEQARKSELGDKWHWYDREWDDEWSAANDKANWQSDLVDSGVTLHRSSVDTVTDTLTTVVAVVVTVIAVVVTALAVVFTAGAGTALIPAIASALSSMWFVLGAAAATTLATMATKYALKGDAYGWEEIGTDAAVGVVEAIAAVLTAGVGDKLLKAGFLAKMAGKGMVSRMVARGLAEAGEGAIQSLPGALTGTLLNDDTYKQGNPVLNILAGAAMGAGPGAVLSGALGSLGGIARPGAKAGKLGPNPSFDLLEFRGSPRERWKLWKVYKEQNPGKSFFRFMMDLDEAILQKNARAFEDSALQRAMRKELFEHLSPAERKAFENVGIEVVSEADFKRLTRSDSGRAVTLFRRGQPVIIVKAGTDLSALGEEGLHLLQSKDRATRRLVKSLDENALANWDKLPVDAQFELYRKKLLLEIDAQERMLASLQRKTGIDIDPVRAKAVLGDVEETLANLRKRLGEVDSVSPFERTAMQRGFLERPDYLDQPARLFAKKKNPAASAQTKAPTDTAQWMHGKATFRRKPKSEVSDFRPKRTDFALEAAERLPLSNTPALTSKPVPPRGSVAYQVGPAWMEHGAYYRLVEVERPNGTIAKFYEEKLKDDGRWVKRGSEAGRAGRWAEDASKRQTIAQHALEPLQPDGTPYPKDQYPAGVYDAADRTVWASPDRKVYRVAAQSDSGSGFDEILIFFQADGTAWIKQVEVKRYSGQVGYSSFTATTVNMPQNLKKLTQAIKALPPQLQGAARSAVSRMNMDIEIRIGPHTLLAESAVARGKATTVGSRSVLDKIQRVATAWRNVRH